MNGSWAEPDVRDEVVDYVRYWSNKTEIKATKMIRWIKITRSKYYDWLERYGKVNEHNAWIPRDFWLADFERQAVIDYYHDNPLEGYRRLCYMMMDADIVAVSRYIVHWEIREAMKESDVEIILQRAREKFPDAKPQIISDNGPQFISKDFKEFIRISGMKRLCPKRAPFRSDAGGKIWPK